MGVHALGRRLDAAGREADRRSGESGRRRIRRSVALSADGEHGADRRPRDNGAVGAAWVFTRTGATWTQQGPSLTGAGETAPADFGDSVALSADGNTALIGAGADNGASGAAWVFTRSGSTWTQQGQS